MSLAKQFQMPHLLQKACPIWIRNQSRNLVIAFMRIRILSLVILSLTLVILSVVFVSILNP